MTIPTSRQTRQQQLERAGHEVTRRELQVGVSLSRLMVIAITRRDDHTIVRDPARSGRASLKSLSYSKYLKLPRTHPTSLLSQNPTTFILISTTSIGLVNCLQTLPSTLTT